MNARLDSIESTTENSVTVAHNTFAHHAKSFRLAANFLPNDNIDDIAVLYHFCRLVDDAVDEAPTIAKAHQNLTEMKTFYKAMRQLIWTHLKA